MWTILKDCSKQLTLHTKLRERVDEHYKVYEISEIEFDQFHLVLQSSAEIPAIEKQHIVLTCKQLYKYNFEVEDHASPVV